VTSYSLAGEAKILERHAFLICKVKVNIFFFSGGYLMMLSVSRHIINVMTDELERILKEAVVAYLR
jgi:hypothetical protein